MNGIIHTCSHPNDDDPSFRISEDKIFSDIFRYLEVSATTYVYIYVNKVFVNVHLVTVHLHILYITCTLV